MQIAVGIGDSVQGFVEAECPKNGEAHADRRAWLAQLQRGKGVAIDSGLAGQVGDRPATPNPCDPDALTKLRGKQ